MSNRDRPPDAPLTPPASRLRLGAAGAALAVAGAIGGAAWLALAHGGTSPEQQIRAALSDLDRPDAPAVWEVARRLAEQVRESGYRDPVFPGAAEFVLGVVATRTAEGDYDRTRELAEAVRWLREAERHGVSEARRPEWAYALGTSLFALGRAQEARPPLEEARASYPEGSVEVGLALAELEIEAVEPDSGRRSDELLAEIAARPDLTNDQKRRLAALRTRAALKAGRTAEAEAALAGLAGDEATDPEVALLWAELRLTQDRPDDARRWLLPLAFPPSVEGDSSRTAAAAYLLGRCDERRGDAASAARAYERAAGLAPESPDGAAAALAAGRLLQQAGRDEEALALFRQAITSQAAGDPPPVPPERFRADLRAAWDLWIAREAFDAAAAIGEASEPVLGRVEGLELQAKSREKAAERIESAWQEANEARREALEPERLEGWRRSGAAYRALAEAVTDSGRTSTALWTAADHLRRGHAFSDADTALTWLVELRVQNLQAAALVRRGQTRLDLGRPVEAAADFQEVLDHHPTAPEAFEARLLLGQAYVDAGDPAKAEAAWRQLLALDELTPDAAEWRAALFALAELLYRRGATALDKAALTATPDGPPGEEPILPLDEAIARFGEFLRRSPAAPQAAEARVLRADALRRRADLGRRMAAVAETENLREIGRREADRLLEEAVAELRAAQAELSPLADRDRLARRGRELLRTTFFDLGHAYAALGRDREAVAAYGAAINRYPDDPRVIAAHLRIAECQRRLGRPDDARAAAEQARLLLDQLPETTLGAGASALTRDEWASWLARLGETDPAPPRP